MNEAENTDNVENTEIPEENTEAQDNSPNNTEPPKGYSGALRM